MLYFLPLLALELELELDEEPPLSLPPHAARTSAADSRQETSTPVGARLGRRLPEVFARRAFGVVLVTFAVGFLALRA